MKRLSPKVFVHIMYLFFRIAFWVQLVSVSILLLLNYFMYDRDNGLHFTVRGNIYAYEEQSKSNTNENSLDSISNIHTTPNMSKNQYGVVTLNTPDNKTTYFLNSQIGFMRIDYSDFSKAFTIENIFWTLFDILIMLLWLFITYQIMKILQSLKIETVFVLKNIKRVKLIGWIFILLPFAQLARDQLFFFISKNHLEIPGSNLFSTFHWYDLSPLSLYGSSSLGTINQPLFPSIALGLMILVIVQIFKNGFELKKEHDLTI